MVPNSSFVISRTAHRSNKSDYYINDRKSNFTEVTDLLKGKGIDLDNNRFLILQVCGACGLHTSAAWSSLRVSKGHLVGIYLSRARLGESAGGVCNRPHASQPSQQQLGRRLESGCMARLQ